MLILITWYLAGMYRAPALMALATAQLMLFIGLFVLSRYLAGGVKLRIPDAPIRVRKRAEDGQGLYVENTGKLPAAFLLRLKYCYPESTEKKDREHCGELGWRETVERGERITPQLNQGLPWCGVAELSIKELRIYDYLFLFCAKKRVSAKLKAVVLPARHSLSLSWEGRTGGWEEDTEGSLHPGDSTQPRWLKEYVPGEPYRAIHWKLSARTDQLWVKEYGQESEERWEQIFLFLGEGEPWSMQSREAFYHILSALLTGILEDGRSAMAVWDDAEGRVHRMETHGEEDVETVLLELYQTLQEIPKSGENDLNGKDRNPEDRSEWNEKEERMRGEGFGLNRNLELFYNGRLLHRFDVQEYEEELEQLSLLI